MLKKVLFLYSFLLLSFIVPSTICAQGLDHVQGELLVKLWPEHHTLSIPNWLESKRVVNGINTSAKYKEQVSAPMAIHAVTFDYTSIDESVFLDAIRRDPRVQAAQFNHFVKLRNEPDDPQFANQWQYINTGQSGGTAGADIDMELAWDIATGGLTADGDTIVACIIDDGINLNHPDIAANLWVNHAEIPNNNIDDDGNGFVDDYRGWDTGSNSDAVGDGGGHGTPVTGIIGAVGNNGIGVAGVNWNVKLMIVQGGTGVESEVLEAYSYPLTARKKYNETDGAEGAFVVSTNASWGIDFGQPADAPLWCAFYDTLGVHGILNCGATANIGINIDVEGDLPTGCSSEYMIAVTNMNDNDVKVNSAGYGIETIDLGAFGQGTWTTSLNNYGGFGGTSGATPHVTGTIALLYSAPCSSLISIAKSDPGAAAAMVRDYIFEGVDPNASLDGITVTGGRLNVNNAINLLMNNCGPCPPPSSLSVSDIIDVSAVFEWGENDSILVSNLEYREVGTMDWQTAENVAAPFTLTGLTACTEYEARIMSTCANEMAVSEPIFFETDGCCVNPEILTVDSDDETSGYAEWTSIFAAQSYELRISELGANNWLEISTSDLNYTFTGLTACTDYEVQIKVLCDGNSVDFSDSQTFTTKGCGACRDFDFCEPMNVNAEEEWIDIVRAGDIDHTTGSNEGFGDFTSGGPTADFVTYQSYSIELVPGFNGNESNVRWRIWIDFNQNGDFSDSGERVFDSGGASSNVVNGEIEIPGSAMSGSTRMRVGMGRSFAPVDCNLAIPFGEMEDYCVNIEFGPAPCNIPTGLDTSDVTATTAIASWDPDPISAATNYEVQYKKTSETTWSSETVGFNPTSLTLSNLDPETEYEFMVRSICGGVNGSAFSLPFTFTTDLFSSTNDPDDLQNWYVYPNPFNGTLNIDFAFAKKQSKIKVDILDQLGRIISEKELDNIPAGQQQVQLNTHNFSDGIHFVRLADEDGNYISKKILKSGY